MKNRTEIVMTILAGSLSVQAAELNSHRLEGGGCLLRISTGELSYYK